MVADTRVIQPDSPPKDWEITPRARTLKDFRIVIGLSVFAALTVGLIALDAIFRFSFEGNIIAAYVILIINVIFLIGSLSDPGHVGREADMQANAKAREWQQNVLAPFLEAKYGIKFRYPLDLLTAWSNPCAIKDGRTIEVQVNGIEINLMSFFDPSLEDSFPGYPQFSLEDEVWLEEVIRPEKVSYRKLETVQ